MTVLAQIHSFEEVRFYISKGAEMTISKGFNCFFFYILVNDELDF